MINKRALRAIIPITVITVFLLAFNVQPVSATVIYVDPVPDPVGSWAQDVYLSGNFAYVAHGDTGLMVVDITNPMYPIISTITPITGDAADVFVFDEYLYVLSAWGDTHLTILDISNPAYPSMLSFSNPIGSVNGFHVKDNWVYTATGLKGLGVINVADPAHPSSPTFCSTNGWAWNIYVSGNYAYVVEKEPGGLTIFDISNPAFPISLSYLGLPNAWGVYVKDDYAYIALGKQGLSIVNIADPYNPGQPIFISNIGDPQGICGNGNYVFVANIGGLCIMEVSNPTQPSDLVFIGTSGYAYDVYVDGNYAYVASGASGLAIIDISDYIKPPPIPAAIDIKPNVLNSRGNHRWITCYIELPEGYSVDDIIIATILLEDIIPAESHLTEIGDHDNDGILDLMVKFSRQALIDYLEGKTGYIDLTATGDLIDGIHFEGTDTILVKWVGKTKLCPSHSHFSDSKTLRLLLRCWH